MCLSPTLSLVYVVLTTMRYLSVVASTHLPSWVTSMAVMGAPRPGMEVLACVSDLLLYKRTLPSCAGVWGSVRGAGECAWAVCWRGCAGGIHSKGADLHSRVVHALCWAWGTAV